MWVWYVFISILIFNHLGPVSLFLVTNMESHNPPVLKASNLLIHC